MELEALGLGAGSTAVVTGAALGIGRSVCEQLAAAGANVVMVDVAADDLAAAHEQVAALGGQVLARELDVADRGAVGALAREVESGFGSPRLLMNNAVTRIGGAALDDTSEWRAAFDVNFWGVVNGVDAFRDGMLASGARSYIVNVGSKQGITNPPGKPIYNIAKAAVKSYTELVQHELRSREGHAVSAHLLVPGFTTTGKREHQPGAWLPEQVVARMLDHLARDSFYMVCPDNEVSESMDRKRILWSAGDITEDRPPLSRWSGLFDAEFRDYDPS